jgi:hypothetical protein
MNMRRIVLRFLLPVVLLIAPVLNGCGVFTARNPSFRNAETGEDGQTYVLDDLRAIARDASLTEDEKRQAFRDLGIEDEVLMTALLTL